MAAHRRHAARPSCQPLESRQYLAARVVGYVPEYRYSLFNSIDLSAVTHLNYFSIIANGDGSLNTTTTGNVSHMDSIVSTAHARGITVSVVIDPGSAFTTMDGNPTARTTFVNNITAFCTAHHLDGIDLDWEPLPPTNAQCVNYDALIHALRVAAPNLILTAAVNPEKLSTDTGLQYVLKPDHMNDLSWINVMGYDLDYANHSPYQRSINDLDGWGNYAVASGVVRSKVLLGVPFYGRMGTSWSNTQAQTYSAILNSYYSAHGSYPSPDADSADGWYFNGQTTIHNKTSYVIDNGYGGVMIWELGQDKFDQHSLLGTIKSTIAASIVNVPSLPDLANSSDSGVSSGDDITNDTTPTFTGTADAGATVEILSNGTVVGSGVATAGTYSITTSALPDGVNHIAARATLNGVTSESSAPLAVTIDTVAPTLVAGYPQLNFLTAPQSIVYRFDEQLSSAAGIAGSYELTNTTTNTPAPLTINYDAPTFAATLTWPSFNVGSGVLTDGNYTSHVIGSITDLAGNPLAGSPFNFFFLSGDANYDRIVDVTDLGILATNWQGSGKTFAQGDFNYDGLVDVTDLGILATNWQRPLPAPAAPVAAATRTTRPATRPATGTRIVQDVLA